MSYVLNVTPARGANLRPFAPRADIVMRHSGLHGTGCESSRLQLCDFVRGNADASGGFCKRSGSYRRIHTLFMGHDLLFGPPNRPPVDMVQSLLDDNEMSESRHQEI